MGIFGKKKEEPKPEQIENPDIAKITSKMTEVIPAKYAPNPQNIPSVGYSTDNFLKVLEYNHIVRIHSKRTMCYVTYDDMMFFAYHPENGVMMYTIMARMVNKQ